AALAVSNRIVLIGWEAPPKLMLVLLLPRPLNVAVLPPTGTVVSQLPIVVQLLSGEARPVHVWAPADGVKRSIPNKPGTKQRRMHIFSLHEIKVRAASTIATTQQQAR